MIHMKINSTGQSLNLKITNINYLQNFWAFHFYVVDILNLWHNVQV